MSAGAELVDQFGQYKIARVARPCTAPDGAHSLLGAALWGEGTYSLARVEAVNKWLDGCKLTVEQFFDQCGKQPPDQFIIAQVVDPWENRGDYTGLGCKTPSEVTP